MPIKIEGVIHHTGGSDGLDRMQTECFIRADSYEFTDEKINCPKCLEIEKKWMDDWRAKGLLKETPSVEEIRKYLQANNTFGWSKGG